MDSKDTWNFCKKCQILWKSMDIQLQKMFNFSITCLFSYQNEAKINIVCTKYDKKLTSKNQFCYYYDHIGDSLDVVFVILLLL